MKARRKRTECGWDRCKVRPSRGFMGMFCARHARELERIKVEFDAKKGYRSWGRPDQRQETE